MIDSRLQGKAWVGNMSRRVCPHWLGYWLANPLRRLIHNPDRILAPLVKSGMTVLDIGPAMGFFSFPLAKMVGSSGQVICVDVQEKMILSLQRRAVTVQLAERIVPLVCRPTSLCIDDFNGKIDFVLAFAVVHEVIDVPKFFAEVSEALKPGALCLVAEPKGHVSIRDFEDTLVIARQKGLHEAGSPKIAWSHTALLKKV